MTLDEIIAVIVAARGAGHDVARTHTGDPLVFGSTAEQMRRLKALEIPYKIVPGSHRSRPRLRCSGGS